MKTKYDWSNVPDDVKWIATNSTVMGVGGCTFGYISKPRTTMFGWDVITNEEVFNVGVDPFQGNWKESLEERPR